MRFDPNPLYYKMLLFWRDRDKRDKLIVCNEGSARSSKTYDGFHFLATYCDHNRNQEKNIYVFRDTLVNCRDHTVKDFKECIGVKGMGIYEEKNFISSPKPYYNLFGHKINFRGLDQESESSTSDFLYFNELLDCAEPAFNSWKLRNEGIIVADWNPKYTDHWAFDLEKLPNCKFTRSTYKNNKHLSEAVIREIEAYSPWMFEDLDKPESERRPHAENVKNGTADKYMFMVYGMGLRANKAGLVFPEVTYVAAFPPDVEEIGYGMDFGMTAQTAIVRIGIRRKHPKSDLFLQKLFYHATPAGAKDIDPVLNALFYDPSKLKKGEIPKAGTYPRHHLHSDNNLPAWVADLRLCGHDVYLTKKFPGSREYWISQLKKYNIHIVSDPDFRKEQENFCYRVVDGVTLSETEKKYDHLWSASGYGVVGDFRQ